MNVKIGNIAQAYINSGRNSREVTRVTRTAGGDSSPPQPQNSDPRFRSPGFRAAVRKVLCHLGYSPTFQNFKLHDEKYGAVIPFAWYEFARNIGNSSLPELETGVYFETHTGAYIEVGKCLESINELIKYNKGTM